MSSCGNNVLLWKRKDLGSPWRQVQAAGPRSSKHRGGVGVRETRCGGGGRGHEPPRAGVPGVPAPPAAAAAPCVSRQSPRRGLDVPVRESLSITPILSCPGIRKVPNSRRTLGSLAETGGTWRVIMDIDHRGHQTPTTGPQKKADGQGERQSAAVTSTLSEVFSGSLSYTLFVLL